MKIDEFDDDEFDEFDDDEFDKFVELVDESDEFDDKKKETKPVSKNIEKKKNILKQITQGKKRKQCGRKKGSGKKQRFVYTHQAEIKELREEGYTWDTISKYYKIKNRKHITPDTYRREFLKLQEKKEQN